MQYVVFLSLAPVAEIACAAALFFTWRHRTAPGARALFWYLITILGFLTCNTLQLLDPTESGTYFWQRFNYVFVAFYPVAWLAFTFSFTHRRETLKFSTFGPFLILPIITIVITWTNTSHHLLWSNLFYQVVEENLSTYIVHAYGPWYYISSFYAAALQLAGAWLILWNFYRSDRLYRYQYTWLILGVFFPLVFNIVYIFQLIPGIIKEFTPISYALSGVVFAIGIFQFRQFDFMPVARTLLVNRMHDGVVVVDTQERVADLNLAAQRVFHLGPSQGIGVPFKNIFPKWPQLLATYEPDKLLFPMEVTIGGPDQTGWFEIQVIPMVIGYNEQRGWLVVLHNVTEQNIEKEFLKRENVELEQRVENRTRALKKRADQLEAVANISSLLRTANTSDSMLAVFLDETMQVLSADRGAILLYDEKNLFVNRLGGQGIPPEVPALQAEDNEWFQIHRADFPMIINKDNPPDQIPGPFARMFAENLQAEIIGTIQSGQQILGVFIIGYGQLLNFQKVDLDLLVALGNLAGNALQRIRAMENMEQNVKQRTRDLSTLYEAASIISSSIEAPVVCRRLLEKLLESLGCQIAFLQLTFEDGSPFFIFTASPEWEEKYPELQTILQQNKLWQEVCSRGKMLVQTTDWTDGQKPVYIGAPIRSGGRVLGALSVLFSEQQAYSPGQIALLGSIADQVGRVVENDALRQLSQKSAVIEERQRLARDLHDAVSQSVYSLTLFANVGEKASHSGDLEQAHYYFQRIQEVSQQALREMRLLIYELRPVIIEQEGLVGALRQRLEAVERRAGLEVSLEVNLEEDISSRLEMELYRVAQEALNNVLKHSGATKVRVRITQSEGITRLEVIDNGKGFDLQSAENQGGIGLGSMRERIKRLGGEITISTGEGEGTHVQADVPPALLVV